METISKYSISIVFVAILCIIVNGNTEVIAEGSKIDPKDKQAWVSKFGMERTYIVGAIYSIP